MGTLTPTNLTGTFCGTFCKNHLLLLKLYRDYSSTDLDHVGLLGDGDGHLDYFRGAGVIVVVMLVIVVIIVRELS